MEQRGEFLNYEYNPMDEVERLKSFIEDRVKGQSVAINAIAKIYEYELTLRSLEDKPGPVGVIMLLGPSGVGKTEIARRLAEYFTGSIEGMIKISCASYAQPHMIHSLIGSPHSYVGYNDSPILSQKNIDELFSRKRPKLLADVQNPAMAEKYKLIARRQLILEQRMELDIKVQHRIQFVVFLEQYNEAVKGFLYNLIDQKENNIVGEGDYNSEIPQIKKDSNKLAKTIFSLSTEIQQHLDLIEVIDKELTKIDRKLKATTNMEEKLPGGTGLMKARNLKKRCFVILFDEIEKANETLHRLLLEITEEGRVTLANGNITDLSNAFVVMTSNVGAREIGDVLKGRQIGLSGPHVATPDVYDKGEFDLISFEKDILKIAEREMGKTFPPEFRRRIDEVVVCRPLSRKIFLEILDFQLIEFSEKLNKRGIKFKMSQEAKEFIVENSMHRREVGASLLSHKFRSLVKRPLGKYLAENPSFTGSVKVVVEMGKIIMDYSLREISE